MSTVEVKIGDDTLVMTQGPDAYYHGTYVCGGGISYAFSAVYESSDTYIDPNGNPYETEPQWVVTLGTESMPGYTIQDAFDSLIRNIIREGYHMEVARLNGQINRLKAHFAVFAANFNRSLADSWNGDGKLP